MKTMGAWFALLGAVAVAVSCAGAEEDGTIIVIVGPDSGAAAGAGGSDASSGGSSGSTGGSGGTASGGKSGASGASGAAGSGGSSGGAGSDGGIDASAGSGGTTDAGSDAPDYDASGPCTPNDLQTQVCGACGTRARLCDSNGTWLEWGSCTGEVGECTPGTQKQETCGKCGKITFFCSSACVYLPGPCENEGTCSPGELNVTNASCPTGQVRTSTCTNQCTAGTWTTCGTSYTWKTMATSPLAGRRDASGAWNGTYFVVAGGYGSTPSYKSDAALYDPAQDAWSPLPAWPSTFVGRELPAVAATATDVIVWGGYNAGAKGDGIRYSFATQTWTAMSTTNGPGGRYDFAYAWDDTAKQLIVFGGRSASSTYSNSIHAYDPATDSWKELPGSIISARAETQFAWDPIRRWFYIWGGYNGGYLADGAVFDADAVKWRVLPAAPAGFTGRRTGGAAVASDKFVVWGGYGSSPSYKTDGIVYDPVTHTWTLMPLAPMTPDSATNGRYNMVALSDGTNALFWGGQGSSPSYKGDGALFNPATMTWKGVSSGALVGSPSGRYSATGAWTSQGVIIWGGYSGSYLADGKVYIP